MNKVRFIKKRQMQRFCWLFVSCHPVLTHAVVKHLALLYFLLAPALLLAQTTEQTDPLRPTRSDSTVTPQPDSTGVDGNTATDDENELDNGRDSVTYRYRLTTDGTVTAGNVSRTLLQLTGAFDWSTSRQIKFSTNPSFVYGKQSGILAEREFFADFRTTYRHEERLYYLAFGSLERSNLRQILSRYTIAAGAGLKLLDRKRAYISLTDVLLHENTDYVELADINLWRNSARLYGEYSFDKDRWTISHTVFYQPAITQQGEGQPRNVRWNASLSVQAKMSTLLSIRTTFASSYESIIVPGRKTTDLRWTMGLVYERK